MPPRCLSLSLPQAKTPAVEKSSRKGKAVKGSGSRELLMPFNAAATPELFTDV